MPVLVLETEVILWLVANNAGLATVVNLPNALGWNSILASRAATLMFKLAGVATAMAAVLAAIEEFIVLRLTALATVT